MFLTTSFGLIFKSSHVKRKIKPLDLLFWGLIYLKDIGVQNVAEAFGVTRSNIYSTLPELHQTFMRELKSK